MLRVADELAVARRLSGQVLRVRRVAPLGGQRVAAAPGPRRVGLVAPLSVSQRRVRLGRVQVQQLAVGQRMISAGKHTYSIP